MRRRYFFGETASEVKEYFEVSAYRNILDMLGTLGDVFRDAANLLFNQAYILREAKGGSQVADSIKGAVGYAHSKTNYSKSDPKYNYSAYFYAVELMKKNIGFAPSWATNSMPKKSPARFDGDDILNLARQIEWEMNRVRLPVPHNFRQLASWLEKNGNFIFKVGAAGGGRTGRKVMIGGDKAVMNYFEMIRIVGDELKAVAEMQKEVRKEIDAAKLAAKVQEDTIRREQEGLISRERAEREAFEREAKIRADKALAYRADYDALLKKIQGATSRADQLLYLGQLRTVVDAINGLVEDSAGKVSVPEIKLLPTPQEIAQVEQAVQQETTQAAQEVISEAQQQAAQIEQQMSAEEKELNELIQQAQAVSDPVLAKALKEDIKLREKALQELALEKQRAAQAVQSAQSVQLSVQSGDVDAAREELKAVEKSKAGSGAVKAALAVLGIMLLN